MIEHFSRLKPLFAVLLLLATTGSSPAQPQDIPKELRAALRASSPVTLYSIYPDPEPSDKRFLGYPILGQAELPANRASELKNAVLNGLEEADPSLKQSCFAPRHGLLLSGQKLLICYQCHSVIAESKSGRKSNLAITDSGHAELARAVNERDLPWQGWQPVQDTLRHQSGLAVSIPGNYKAYSSAGSETLLIESNQESVQSNPLPGAFVLVQDDGTEQTYPTKWLSHAETGKPIWYLHGVSSTLGSTENRRIFRGTSDQLSQVKDYLTKADVPTTQRARVKLRPVDDELALKTQHHRLRRRGYLLKSAPLNGFKTGTALQGGVEMQVTVGLVPTRYGPVLVSAEIPVGQPDPLPDLIRDLRN
jgi:hypothetical protein